MGERPPEPHASSSPAVAASSAAEEIEVLGSEDVLPMAAEDFDPDNTGYISTEKFRALLQRHGSELDPHKLEVLLALADSNSEGRICYQDFVNLEQGQILVEAIKPSPITGLRDVFQLPVVPLEVFPFSLTLCLGWKYVIPVLSSWPLFRGLFHMQWNIPGDYRWGTVRSIQALVCTWTGLNMAKSSGMELIVLYGRDFANSHRACERARTVCLSACIPRTRRDAFFCRHNKVIRWPKMSNKRSNSFRQAILQGNRRLCSKALLEETGLSLTQRLIRHVAYETLPREIDRKWYYDSYTCCPPPWFMITITIVEVAFFLYNGVVLDRFVLQVTHPLYLKNSLVYHPQLRAQAWRYLTYIFMHAGIEHLGLNVILQLLVGVPLEMVHGAARISFVYIAGVVAGSLAVSVADMTAPVVGSSGGVYALVSAHLANIVMNWSGMKCQFKLLRMAVALICMSFEFGRAVWLRFHPSAYPPCPHPSFMAHLGGVVVGITLGVIILRNYEQRLQDQSLWWIFISIYLIFVLFAIFWNIFAYNLLDLKLPPPP